MAFDSRKFAVRAGSSAVFVIIFLGCLLYSYQTFSVFFLVIACGALYEFYKLAASMGARPFRLVGFALGIWLYLANMHWELLSGSPVESPRFLALIITPFIVLACAVFSRNENPLRDALFTLCGICYAIIPFALMHPIVIPVAAMPLFTPLLLLGVVLLIWANDTFAYLGGSFFGKHKMIARISPGKTWEGTITGVILSIVLGLLLGEWLLGGKGGTPWTAVVICTPILATIGDLVESQLKRHAGVKDSGSIMPGHGGFLDRFDSLIFTTPFVYVILKLL